MTQNREIGADYSSYCISHLSFFVNITYSLIIFHMRSLNVSKLPGNSNAHMDPIRYTMHLNHVWYTLVIMTEIVVTYSTRASIVHKHIDYLVYWVYLLLVKSLWYTITKPLRETREAWRPLGAVNRTDWLHYI